MTPRDANQASREELAEAAWRRVAYEGLESTTIRGVASEAGTSTGRVVHYFRSKDELLLEALRFAGRKIGRRIKDHLGSLEGLAAIDALIHEELPLDAGRRAEWRVWLAFWSRSAVQPELADEHARRLSGWRDLLLTLLQQAAQLGEIDPKKDLETCAERIIAMVNGLGVQLMLAPELLPHDHLERHVRELLDSLRV